METSWPQICHDTPAPSPQVVIYRSVLPRLGRKASVTSHDVSQQAVGSIATAIAGGPLIQFSPDTVPGCAVGSHRWRAQSAGLSVPLAHCICGWFV